MKILRPLLAIVVGFILGLLVTGIAGENPFHILSIFARSSFGSIYDFGMTLVYSTPLILTGLSVAMAFKAGLFNIGAEGQMTIGALAAAVVGATFTSLPPFIAPLFATLCAACAGGVWGGIAGYLKAKRSSHEVISTIMLNFIAAGVASYFTVNLMRDPATQSPQTLPIAPQYAIHTFSFFHNAPVTYALILSIFLAIAAWFLLYRTPLGYEIRAVGENEIAAADANISVPRIQILSMFFAGALAGLVGYGEVLGKTGCYKLDFSPGYGFTGIAVAFLGRGNPIAIIFSAFLFGILQKGSGDLEVYTHNVTVDLVLVLQAFIILAVSADGVWDKVILRIRKKLHD